MEVGDINDDVKGSFWMEILFCGKQGKFKTRWKVGFLTVRGTTKKKRPNKTYKSSGEWREKSREEESIFSVSEVFYIWIYIYIYTCVCVCVYIYI